MSGSDSTFPITQIKKVFRIDKKAVGLLVQEGPTLQVSERPLVPDILALRLARKLRLGFSDICSVSSGGFRNDIQTFVRNGYLHLRIAPRSAQFGKGFVWAEVGLHDDAWEPRSRGQIVFRDGRIHLYNSLGAGLHLNDVSAIDRFIEDQEFRNEDDHPNENRSWTEYRFEFRTNWGESIRLSSGGRDPKEHGPASMFAQRVMTALGLRMKRLWQADSINSGRAGSGAAPSPIISCDEEYSGKGLFG